MKNEILKNNKFYSDEELKFFQEIELGNYKSMNQEELKKEKQRYGEYAKNTLKKLTKKKVLNIRVYENDLPLIKAKALEKGLPYQTFLASIIHQVANNKIPA